MIRRQRAMTFMEMLFVIITLAILMAIALPNLSGFRDGTALRTAARDITSAGLLARQIAIVQQEATYIYFDPTKSEWNIAYLDHEAESQLRLRDQRGRSGDERTRYLPPRVTFKQLRTETKELPIDRQAKLTFYPSGSSSGLAIQLVNNRDRTLVVEFDRATGRPEVYEGDPKTLSQKLRERGLNPLDYGLPDDRVIGRDDNDPGFRRVAGQSEDERVQSYKDAVDRMMERSRVNHEIKESGNVAEYYRDQASWGGVR